MNTDEALERAAKAEQERDAAIAQAARLRDAAKVYCKAIEDMRVERDVAREQVLTMREVGVAFLERYESDCAEGDGIPEDAADYECAVRELMPSPMECECIEWAGSLAPRQGHHEKCVWERRRATLTNGPSAGAIVAP